MVNKIKLSAWLTLVILSTAFYMLYEDNFGKLRIDFTETKTLYKVYENGSFPSFPVVAKEFTRAFDGTKLMRAKNRSINYTINFDNTTDWYRIANFKERIIVEDFVEFDNLATNIEDVPVSHEICFTNAQGKIFEYLITHITYDGVTKNITSPFSFGKNMKVTFQEGYYRAKVYNNKVAPDKIIVRYRIKKDYECFDVRMFDPPAPSVFIDINATSLTVGNFAINNCSANLLKDYGAYKRYRLNCSGATDAIRRAKMYKTLFYGTDGTNERVSGITGLTNLFTSVSRDIGKNAYYAKLGTIGIQGGSDEA